MSDRIDYPASPASAAGGNRALFRLLAINGIAGALLGVGFVGGVLALDIASIRTLLWATGDWVVALSLLTMGSVVTFASVAMGGAIMMIPRDKGDPPGRLRAPALVPVPVLAGQRRRPAHKRAD